METLRVYGSEVSYFTGKLEAYLRYKQIPYVRIAERCMDAAKKRTGVAQIPSVELPDGRLLVDTTPTIAWFESEHPEPAVIPADPLQAFFALLLEDYGDEWLWRPAMHYRWDYSADSLLLRRKLVDEITGHVPLPKFLKRFIIFTRQRRGFTLGDGVSAATWGHVEGIYLKNLEYLRAIFRKRPFLFGDLPTVADFGYFASMFRHFGQDPTPSTIMRETAPEVYEWVARLWNARADTVRGNLVTGVPEDIGPILDEIGATYLQHLCANAEALKAGRKRFDVEMQGVCYRSIRASAYRVWCLEQLRKRFDALPPSAQDGARAILEKHGCWEPLWRVAEIDSGVDPDGEAPFGGAASMTGFNQRFT
jgi:glutathione S-transferase